MKQGKLEVDFGVNYLWVTCSLNPDGQNLDVREDWKAEPDNLMLALWEMQKWGWLQDVARRLRIAERAVFN